MPIQEDTYQGRFVVEESVCVNLLDLVHLTEVNILEQSL